MVAAQGALTQIPLPNENATFLENLTQTLRALLVLFNDAEMKIKKKRLRQNIAKFNYNVELILENHVYPEENCVVQEKADVEVYENTI